MDNHIEYYGLALVGSIKELGRAPSQIAKRSNISNLPIEKFSHLYYPSEKAGFVFHLSHRAKASDFIPVSGYAISALMVKESVYSILSQFNIQPHRVYDADVTEDNGKHHSYKWLHFIYEDASQYIDFKQSTFATYVSPFLQYKKNESVDIDTQEQYYAAMNENPSIGIETIVFKQEFTNQNYDLFIIPLPIALFYKFIVTKKLAIALKQNNLTVFRLRELPNWR